MSERFDRTDLPPRGLAHAGAWFAITLVVISIGVFVFFHFLRQGHPARLLRSFDPPPPRLQMVPTTDLANLRAREETALTTYHWMDREHQVIAIPIDRAIDLTVERGLPARTSP
jgi:hypothetical protein